MLVSPGYASISAGLDLEGSLVIHSMAMNDVSNLETGKVYCPNAFDLVVEVIAFQVLLNTDVGKHTVSPALPDIESLPVAQGQ